MNERGKFVVVEGVGGAGKSTVLVSAKDYLCKKGLDVLFTREPGGVPSAEKLREMLFNLKSRRAISTDHEVALLFAARSVTLQEQIVPNLDKGVSVIVDRSYPSTFAYQGYGGGSDLEIIRKFTEEVMKDCLPDAIVLLDISHETSLDRNAGHRAGDPFDELGLEFQKRVIKGYREMAKDNWLGVPWHVVDAERSLDLVQKDINECLWEILTFKS